MAACSIDNCPWERPNLGALLPYGFSRGGRQLGKVTAVQNPIGDRGILVGSGHTRTTQVWRFETRRSSAGFFHSLTPTVISIAPVSRFSIHFWGAPIGSAR